MPLHLHMHDTAGSTSPTYLAAIEAGVDVVDGAVSSMAGMTSQPSLSSLAFALAGRRAIAGLDSTAREAVRLLGAGARHLRAVRVGPGAPPPTSTCTRSPAASTRTCAQQAEALGVRRRALDAVKRTYAEVNQLFGDIVKVTPSSKVVGDMAIWMVKQGLDACAVTERGARADLPQSFFFDMRGSQGQPPGGFPEPLRTKILKGVTHHPGAPGRHTPPLRLGVGQRDGQLAGVEVARRDVVSYALYPKVMREYMEQRALHGDTSVLPTRLFLYGPARRRGSRDSHRAEAALVKLLSIGDIQPDGARVLTFESPASRARCGSPTTRPRCRGRRRRAAADKKGEIARRCRAGSSTWSPRSAST